MRFSNTSEADVGKGERMDEQERTEYEADLNAARGREEENARRLKADGLAPLEKGDFKDEK